MKGIKFVTDANGKKVAVQIDLKKYGELWEDFQDAVIAHKRQDEPRSSWEEVKQSLKKSGKLK
jgi:hypothetical protein